MKRRTLTWASSTWARWLGGTVLFSLAQLGALSVSCELDQVLPGQVLWVLVAGLVALAFLIGVRLRTGWWMLGPVVAYSVPATIYLIVTNAEDQARRSYEQVLVYAVLAVVIGAILVMLPCTIAAFLGAAWTDISRTRATGRRGPTAREVLLARSAAMTAPRPHPSRDQGPLPDDGGDGE